MLFHYLPIKISHVGVGYEAGLEIVALAFRVQCEEYVSVIHYAQMMPWLIGLVLKRKAKTLLVTAYVYIIYMYICIDGNLIFAFIVC